MITQQILDNAVAIFAAKAAEFAKAVQPYYARMEWEWTMGPSEPPRVPEEKDILETVNMLASRLKPQDNVTSADASTGGIEVSVTVYPKLGNHVTAEIKFIPVVVRETVLQ